MRVARANCRMLSFPFSMMTAVQQGDLYLSPGRGGGGLGDPLERPPERVADDVSSGHLLERLERA